MWMSVMQQDMSVPELFPDAQVSFGRVASLT